MKKEKIQLIMGIIAYIIFITIIIWMACYGIMDGWHNMCKWH